MSWARRSDSVMHKDKPPGVFDLSDRSIQYAAGFFFVVGFVLSVIVRVGMVLDAVVGILIWTTIIYGNRLHFSADGGR
jgi:hypothetical protein